MLPARDLDSPPAHHPAHRKVFLQHPAHASDRQRPNFAEPTFVSTNTTPGPKSHNSRRPSIRAAAAVLSLLGGQPRPAPRLPPNRPAQSKPLAISLKAGLSQNVFSTSVRFIQWPVAQSLSMLPPQSFLKRDHYIRFGVPDATFSYPTEFLRHVTQSSAAPPHHPRTDSCCRIGSRQQTSFQASAATTCFISPA